MSETQQTQEKVTLRSLILKYFPPELLATLELVTETFDVDNNSKVEYFIKPLLDKYNVPYTPLGNGTNRYGILIDGYAFKIALDRAGRVDNQREFKYVKQLPPSVVKVYEITENGIVSVLEYITIFSLDDFYSNQDKMREILKVISDNFLVGDVGVSTVNYVNWGTRNNGEIAILDFAYIYSLTYKAFLCTCEDEGTLKFDKDCVYLICPFCRKKYTFEDIRRRITKQDEKNEIGDVMKLGYILTQSEQVVDYDPDKSPSNKLEKKAKKKKHKQIHPKRPKKQDWDMDGVDQEAMLRSLDKIMK